MNGTVDLHLHTNASDGLLPPREVVRLCADMGLQTIAITDHDTLEGVPEAMRAGNEMKLEVIPAIEMSAGGSELEIHIIGYFADPINERIQQWLRDQLDARLMRAARVVARLREVDVYISLDEVQKAAGEGRPCCRPHIARVIADAGYARTVNEAFNTYLSPGKPGYIPIDNPPASVIIERMRSLRMVPVLAHGALIRQSVQNISALIEHMAGAGLLGLECYHSGYDRSMERFMLGRAKEHNLVVTGGSDFHGASRHEVFPRTGLTNWTNDQECVKELKRRR